MIRFRFQEDERRFLRLHAEMYEKLARAGYEEGVGSEMLRNTSKIGMAAYYEGIRQGLAMAAIVAEMEERGGGAIPEPYAHKAFQLHAIIYGSSDTPLRTVEKEWLERIDADPELLSKSWLDDKPMRFAPLTVREIDGTAPPIAPMISVKAAEKPRPIVKASAEPAPPKDPEEKVWPLPSPSTMHGAEVTEPPPGHKGEYEPDDPVALLDTPEPPPDDDRESRPESPEFLDTVRDAIQTLQRGGWAPKSWHGLVLALHRHMHVDASFIDLQLSTHVGRNVLAQCGIHDVAIPDMIDFDLLAGPPDEK